MPPTATAGTAYAGPVRGDTSQVLYCTIANITDMPQAIEIRVFDSLGTQTGTATSELAPGQRTFIGVNAENSSFCRFDYEGLNDDVIVSGCLNLGFGAVEACAPVKYIAEPVETFPPGPPSRN